MSKANDDARRLHSKTEGRVASRHAQIDKYPVEGPGFTIQEPDPDRCNICHKTKGEGAKLTVISGNSAICDGCIAKNKTSR